MIKLTGKSFFGELEEEELILSEVCRVESIFLNSILLLSENQHEILVGSYNTSGVSLTKHSGTYFDAGCFEVVEAHPYSRQTLDWSLTQIST